MKAKTLSFIKILSFILLCGLFYIYWNDIGIFFIENILVIDLSTVFIAGAVSTKSIVAKKTFLGIIKKIGYRKFFFSIFWVILKRYLIEASTNYFKKHSFKRFKNNFFEVLKLKFKEIQNISFVKKIVAAFSFVIGSSVVYFIFTNYLSKIIIGLLQKFFYVIILIGLKFLGLLIGVFLFIFTSVIQVFFLIKIINYIEKFKIVKFIYNLINIMFKKVLSIFDLIFNTKLHLSLIKLSKSIDEYFASILDRNFSLYEVIQRRRDRYINTIEYISIQRIRYKEKKQLKKKSFLKQYNHAVKKYIKNEKTWREKREEYYLKQKLRRLKINRKAMKKTVRKSKLLLPDKN